MKKILVPIDLIFVPAQTPHITFDDKFCRNEFVPIVACPSIENNKTKNLLPYFLKSEPVIDDYDRDRLIVKRDVDNVVEAKAKGKNWISAKAPPEILARWEARSVAKLKELVAETGRAKFYNPVYLQEFRHAKISRPSPIRLDRIRRLFGPLGSGLTGLDIGCNIGFTAHHMARQGFSMTALDFDPHHLQVAKCLTDAYGLQVELVEKEFDQFEPNRSFDLVFALTVLYHIFFRQNKIAKIDAAKKVSELTGSILIWESGDNPEAEKELLLSDRNFSTYRTLGKTQGTGLDREMGFFCKDDTALGKWLLSRYEAVGARWIVEG